MRRGKIELNELRVVTYSIANVERAGWSRIGTQARFLKVRVPKTAHVPLYIHDQGRVLTVCGLGLQLGDKTDLLDEVSVVGPVKACKTCGVRSR